MVDFKSVVTATAVLLLCQGIDARVTRRNGTPAGPFCTDFTPFGYAGCFQDPGSPRALPFSSNISSTAMTTEICVSFCKGNGYRYAGLEYYGECWCGASVQGMQVADSSCNFPCTGNSSESCGGNYLLTVYQDPTFPYDNISTISDYTSSGCWTEGSNGRALVYRQDALATSTLTVEQCLFSCKAGGYPLAGVEFGSECYCGVVLGNGTAQVASNQCNMPCNGNTSETCGGPSLLNLYVAKDLISSQPCKDLSPSPPVSSSVPSSTSPPSASSSSTSPPSTSPPSTSSSTSPPPTSPPPTSSSPSPSTSPSSSVFSNTTTTTPSTILTTTLTTSSTTTPLTTTTTSPTTTPTSTSTPTSPPTTTINTSTTSKTTSSIALCTTTIAPSCEYSCGSWCSNPLPDWSGSSDCETAASHCLLQVAGCFAHATFPDSLKCFEFSAWCKSISSYCSSTCAWGKCSKDDCSFKYPPAGNPSKPTTSIYTCIPTSTATTIKPTSTPSSTTCTTVPVPTSSNICQQPHNPGKGYTSSSPCGGIALPCLTCNNIKSDYDSGSCFKLYTNKDTYKCPSYHKPSVTQGCKDACLAQYNSCVGTYAESCKSRGGWKEKREASAKPNWGSGGWGSWGGSWGGSGDDYNSASQKCQSQYQDCLSLNEGVNPGNRCGSWNSGWQ